MGEYTMGEYEVDIGRWPPVRIQAGSQDEAEEIARRDGHRVKPKGEVDRERAEYAAQLQEQYTRRVADGVRSADRAAGQLDSVLLILNGVKGGQPVFDEMGLAVVADHLGDKYATAINKAMRAVANALASLRAAIPFAEDQLRNAGAMTPDEFLDTYGD